MKRLLVIAALCLWAGAAYSQPSSIAWRPPTGCTDGQGISFDAATNRWVCETFGAGFSTNNVIPKGDGAGLVSSSLTDNGSWVASSVYLWSDFDLATGQVRVGDSYVSTTAADAGMAFSFDGTSEYWYSKLNTGGSILGYVGAGAEAGTARQWIGVTGSTGAVTLPALLTATAGVATPANLTTTGTGSITSNNDLTVGDELYVNGATTLVGVLDVNNDLAKFGSSGDGLVYIYGDIIGAGFASDTDGVDLAFNYGGFGGGNTRYRDAVFYDGRNAVVLTITGSTKDATFASTATVTGLLTATAGVTTPANLTTTGTGSLVVAGTGSVGDTLTVSDAANAGNVLVVRDSDGDAFIRFDAGAVSNQGFFRFNDTGQYLSMSVGAGTDNDCTLSNTAVWNCVGGLQENGAAVLSGGISSNVLPKGSGGNLADSDVSNPSSGVVLFTSDSRVYVDSDTLNFHRGIDTDNVTGYINYYGYNSGTTRDRNLIIADGKGAAIATFTGSTKAVSVTGNLSTNANLTAGDATSDSHTLNGETTSLENVGATFASGQNLVLQDSTSMAAGVGGAIKFDGAYTGTTNTTAAVIKAAKTNGTDANYSFDLVMGTRLNGGGVGERLRITDGGAIKIGDTGTNAVENNLDVLTIGNTGTGQTTTGLALISATNTGSYNTTSGSLTYAGISVSVSATESAGSNTLTGIAAYLSATNGDDPIGLWVDNGRTRLDGALQVDGDISDSNSDVTIADGLVVTGPGAAVTDAITFGYSASNGFIRTKSSSSGGASNIYFQTTTVGGVTQTGLSVSNTQHVQTESTFKTMGDATFGHFPSIASHTVNGRITQTHTPSASTTSGTAVYGITNNGTYNTTSGNITYYGADIAVSATESAGSNALTGVALRLSATNGDNAIALRVDAGRTIIDEGAEIDGSASIYGRIYLAKDSTDSYGNQIWVDSDDPPAVSSCGTSPSIVGGDAAGVVTVGTGTATSCTITFETAYVTNAPSCVLTSEANNGNPLYFSSKTTSAFTVTTSAGTNLAGQKFNYICFGVTSVVNYNQ